VVRDYDAAIHFFVDVLQFELVEDTPSLALKVRRAQASRRQKCSDAPDGSLSTSFSKPHRGNRLSPTRSILDGNRR
jgi:catechol 2,3-dioxygenase-like lactoylglutathione lyase family enzyme